MPALLTGMIETIRNRIDPRREYNQYQLMEEISKADLEYRQHPAGPWKPLPQNRPDLRGRSLSELALIRGAE